MAKDVIIRGVTYQGIDKLSLPISGGSALFRDTSGADAAAADIVRGKTAYGASGLITGTHDLPSGSISITDNGVYDVTDYASAFVSVSGGGGPSASDAILLVTVPANSIVTMSKGNTTLTPTLWTMAADSNYECALFIVEPSLFDSTAWTVTASASGGVLTDTVVIDSAKQYEMVLHYGRLYWEGDENVGVTGGWTPEPGYWASGYSTYPEGGPYIVRNASNIFFRTNQSGLNNGKAATLSTANKIDLTKYSTLYIRTPATAGYSNCRILSVASQNSGLISDYDAAYSALAVSSSTQITSVDISAVTGEYYVCLTIWNRNNAAAEVTFDRIWME